MGFTKSVKIWLRQRVTLSCAVTVIKFCVGPGKSPAEKMKSIRSSETMNPCSVSVVYNGGRFEGWSALRCENDYEGHNFWTRLGKS